MLVLSLLAGAAIGAVYSLQGVYAYELIDPGHLGTLLGIAQAVFSAGGALGPLAAGALLGATGSGAPVVTIISAGFAVPPACSCSAGHPARPRPATPPPNKTAGDPDATDIAARCRGVRVHR